MKYSVLLILVFISMVLQAQEKRATYATKFIPYHITYNGSDDPNECWESVAYGIVVNREYFSLPFNALEELKTKMGDAEITVEVVYYEEPYENSGEVGSVLKITLDKQVLWVYKQ
ncbi:MAG TPA: hypothetical protein VD905_01435 [Flavobacteriales bacterium]|nr:hypothetical protein [Flavobacteriales bacterium]